VRPQSSTPIRNTVFKAQKNKVLLVTGATGHTGTYFMKRLGREEYKGRIRCSVRTGSDLSFIENLGLDIEFKVGDLNEDSFANDCMRGAGNVIHIAGIHFSRNIARAAVANGVDCILFVHTTGRYSQFKSASADYVRIEDFVTQTGLPRVVLRPTMIYGSLRDKNIHQLIAYLDKHRVFPVFGQGTNLMQPIHARDLADAIFQAWDMRERTINKEYNVAGRTAMKYLDLLKTVSAKLHRNTTFVKIPLTISLVAVYFYNALNAKAKISVEQVMRMNEDKTFDYGDAERDFGFSPMTFDEGVGEEVDEYRLMSKRTTGQTNPRR